MPKRRLNNNITTSYTLHNSRAVFHCLAWVASKRIVAFSLFRGFLDIAVLQRILRCSLFCLLPWLSFRFGEFDCYGQLTSEATIARAVMNPEHMGENRLKMDAWHPFGDGFETVGMQAMCHNERADQIRGMSQSVQLNQQRPEQIVASLESKAEGVGGEINQDYALYIDLVFTDGTRLYGRSRPFDVGTHDWQHHQLIVIPKKPVKSLTFYGLFRHHEGKVWFQKAKLTTQPVPRHWHRIDGVDYVLHGDPCEGVQIRDVASNGPFVHLRKEALGVQMKVAKQTESGVTFYEIALRDTSGKDRAMTLMYSFPVKEESQWWLADPRRREEIQSNTEYFHGSAFPGVGNERLSLYPLAAVANDQRGVAVGIDMARPAFYRLLYHSATQEMLLLYDLGFSSEKPTARLRFCRYSFEPQWGFRAAVDRYYQLFPEAFRRRVKKQGNWMAFAPISKVHGWEDFGFAFKEGHDEIKWDDAHGITTFRYTEPATWWMNMPPKMPRTLDAAVAEAKRLANGGNVRAKAVFTSGFQDPNGKLIGRMRNVPWANGIVWSMNSMPGIQGEFTDFSVKWNPAIVEKMYESNAEGRLDGEYFDSGEGYATELLDYRRETFSAAKTPLCFASGSKRPGIFRSLMLFEYMRAIAKEVHQGNRLVMANSTPAKVCWCAPLLDVMGAETNWNRNQKWNPMADADLLYRRVMCKTKPYCFLQNTSFEHFSHDMVEKYMQRSVAYGVFPSFFSHNASEGHYFKNPNFYERDRDLFKKYMPLCQRVAQAGWQPITMATSDNDRVYVERFGENLLTVLNDSDQEQSVTLRVQLDPGNHSRDLVTDRPIQWDHRQTRLTLGAEEVAVLQLGTP